MQAKEITWKGMKFRSKLEARYYNHFKNLGWDFDYEPDVPGLVGYQPDFVIYPDKKRDRRFREHKPIYVEIKPIRDVFNYYTDPEYENFREKIKKYWNPKNDLILFGGSLKGKYDRAATSLCLENTIYDHPTSYGFHYSYHRGYSKNIGLTLMHMYEYILDENTSHIYFDYKLDDYKLDTEYEKIIEKVEGSWNNAWSQMRWEAR
jgi:hypothetical protein